MRLWAVSVAGPPRAFGCPSFIQQRPMRHAMRFQPLAIPDVVLIEPHLFRDPRGSFFHAYEAGKYAAARITATLLQANHSAAHAGALRGLHYQLKNPDVH